MQTQVAVSNRVQQGGQTLVRRTRANNSRDLVKELVRYTCPQELSMPKRIAHCLDWCAKECPNQYVTLQILLKSVMGFSKVPNVNSKEVIGLRSKWTPVRKILLDQYRRDLVIERGIGVRATDGSEDVAKSTLGTKIRRFEGAKKAVEKTLAIVDTSEVKDKQLKAWVDTLRPAFKALASPDFTKKLLPPAAEDKK